MRNKLDTINHYKTLALQTRLENLIDDWMVRSDFSKEIISKELIKDMAFELKETIEKFNKLFERNEKENPTVEYISLRERKNENKS